MTFEMTANSGLDLGKLLNILYLPLIYCTYRPGVLKNVPLFETNQNVIRGPVVKLLIGRVDQDQIVILGITDLVILLIISKFKSF